METRKKVVNLLVITLNLQSTECVTEEIKQKIHEIISQFTLMVTQCHRVRWSDAYDGLFITATSGWCAILLISMALYSNKCLQHNNVTLKFYNDTWQNLLELFLMLLIGTTHRCWNRQILSLSTLSRVTWELLPCQLIWALCFFSMRTN